MAHHCFLHRAGQLTRSCLPEQMAETSWVDDVGLGLLAHSVRELSAGHRKVSKPGLGDAPATPVERGPQPLGGLVDRLNLGD